MEIELFIPCFIDQLYPETAFNTVKILEKLGITVIYNPKQTCCGQPAFNSGYWDETAHLAKKFLHDFSSNRLIVSPSASCTAFVKKHYPKLSSDKDFVQRHQKMHGNLYELSDFLVNYLKVSDLGARFPAQVTYHDSCSALREYGIRNEPRALLSQVADLELIEMKHSDVCCGFGGTFSVKNEPISTAMAQQKVENALATGAEYIVSTEASCMLHIQAYIAKHKIAIKTIHLADILASGIE